jgi:hypothetical protein
MPSRRRPPSLRSRPGLPDEVPEVTKPGQPAAAAPAPQQADADVLPEELRKMLEAAYT